MKKNLEFVKLVTFPVFRSCVVVLIGDITKLKRRYDVCVRKLGCTNAPEYDSFAGRFAARYEEDPSVLASTLSEFGDAYIHLKEWRSGVFVHEAYHAAQAIMKMRGIDDEEVGAYITEYLFNEVCNTEKLDGNMRRKLK